MVHDSADAQYCRAFDAEVGELAARAKEAEVAAGASGGVVGERGKGRGAGATGERWRLLQLVACRVAAKVPRLS